MLALRSTMDLKGVRNKRFQQRQKCKKKRRMVQTIPIFHNPEQAMYD